MRYKVQIFLLFSFILISSTAYGQKIVTSLGGGVSLPMAESDFSDSYDLGINAGINAGYLLNNNFVARVDVQYNKFSYKESSNSSFTVITSKIDLLAGDFNRKKKFHPYGLIGTGTYFLNSEATSGGYTISLSETDFGVGVGAGVIVDVSPKIGIFAETQYNFIFNDGTAKGYLPVKAGIFIRH